MTKKILALGLSLILVACTPLTNKENPKNTKNETSAGKDDQEVKIVKAKYKNSAKNKLDKKDTDKDTDRNISNQASDIFLQLKGREFNSYLTNGSERIFFYEDGRFDGASWSGDGVSMIANLYTGKLSNPRRIDDKTYAVRLKSLDYQSPTSGSESRDGVKISYTRSRYFDKNMVGDEYLIHLPGTELADLDRNDTGYMLDYDPDVENGKINMYSFSKEGLDLYPQAKSCLFLTESKNAQKKTIKPGENYFTTDIYGDNYKAQPGAKKKEKVKPENGPKKTTGINKTPEAIGMLDHATQIDMADVFITNYKKSKEKAIGQVIESENSYNFIKDRPQAFYNIDYSVNYLDRLEDKTLSDVDFENGGDQPIIKVLGEIIDSRRLEPSYDSDNQYVNIYEHTLLASKRDGELILISLDFMGDIETATFVTEEGTDLVKAWALPLATYTIDHKDYGKIKVYKFAGGEGMQEAAFEKYGESYGF